MEGEFPFQGKAREGGDIVDDAVGEVGGGADEEDGVAVYEAGDGGEVHAVGRGGTGDEVDFYFEVGACFAEGGVCGFGEDYFGFCDAALDGCFLARGEDGHEDRIGAAGGGDAGGAWGGVEHGEDHGDDFGFHFADAGEDVGMDGVGDAEGFEGGGLEGDEGGAAVVDSAADEAVFPAGVVHGAKFVELGANLSFCPSFFGESEVVAHAWAFGD